MKCANPLCLESFRAPSGGKLFIFENQSVGNSDGGLECQWLCPKCALKYVIVETETGAAVARRLRRDKVA